MRGRSAGKVAAALWVGLAASAARAEDREAGDLHSLPPVKETSWPWSGWFGKKEAKPEAKPAAKPAPAADAAAPAPRPAANDPLSVLDRELNAFNRRMEVCLQLEQFAVDTDNIELQRQVDELKQRAFEVYQRRALRLGGGAAAVDPLDAQEKGLTRDTPPAGMRPGAGQALAGEGKR